MESSLKMRHNAAYKIDYCNPGRNKNVHVHIKFIIIAINFKTEERAMFRSDSRSTPE